CPPSQAAPGPESSAPTVAEAEAFMKGVEEQLKALWIRQERAHWIKNNFITHDTQEIAAEADQATMEYLARTIKAATRFDALDLPPDLRRRFKLLKIATNLPAPADSAKAAE